MQRQQQGMLRGDAFLFGKQWHDVLPPLCFMTARLATDYFAVAVHLFQLTLGFLLIPACDRKAPDQLSIARSDRKNIFLHELPSLGIPSGGDFLTFYVCFLRLCLVFRPPTH